MSLATEAFKGLFPESEPSHDFAIKYSGKFNDYNANVYYTSSRMEFRLSKQWRGVERDIRIGLLQTLMLKVFGKKGQTLHMDLYNILAHINT